MFSHWKKKQNKWKTTDYANRYWEKFDNKYTNKKSIIAKSEGDALPTC